MNWKFALAFAAAALFALAAIEFRKEFDSAEKVVKLLRHVDTDRTLRDKAVTGGDVPGARQAHWRMMGSFSALRQCAAKLGGIGRMVVEIKVAPEKVPAVITWPSSPVVPLHGTTTTERLQTFFEQVSLVDRLPEEPKSGMPIVALVNKYKKYKDEREAELRRIGLACDD